MVEIILLIFFLVMTQKILCKKEFCSLFYTSRLKIKLYLNAYLFIFYLYFPDQIVEGDYTQFEGGTYSAEVTLVIQRYTGRNFILWHFVVFKRKWWFVSFDLILWLIYVPNWWNIRNPSVNFSFKLGLGKGNQTFCTFFMLAV